MNRSIWRFVQDFKNVEIVKKLGDNDVSYQNVFICKIKGDQKHYVCKIIKRALNPLEFVVPVLMQHNPHFLKLYSFAYNKRGEAAMIFNYIPDGDLYNLINRKNYHFDEATCQKIILSLVNAIHDLHKRQIVHNDIKLENLLYDTKRKRLHICDYGLTQNIGTPCVYDGTTLYYCPEKIAKQPYACLFDWWAIGVVSYEILSSQFPYNTDDYTNEVEPHEMLPLIAQPLPPIENITPIAMDFVTKMLSFDINLRLNSYDKIIKHPFLNNL
ncbi:pk-1 [Cnaphalocrocis medinalis granulovirus]|uniref:Pk-1 n=1 Tax=Cnaphalocrocis medinalis granulovirus TaxID=1750712 RepID=A0A0X9H2T6_9BBAC|nr:pk-1 [Cnaphalocrocis medinalis granulovirus]ALN41936.1 pk-1 [Cnaphalocrocis medinalis granulovirus]AMF83754.1 pk-1 [Cnaphalocrocis medinalis granulovirus]WPN08635.1 pk-1 [Cnaphalocrocis medinalis granulovirus]